MRDIVTSPSKKPVVICCSICHDEINDSTGSTKLSCSHLYHLACIVKWLSINPSCPCCRKSLTEHEDVKQTQVNSDQEFEITGDDLIVDEITAESLTYAEMIEAAIIQINLPPHLVRMPLALQAFE